MGGKRKLDESLNEMDHQTIAKYLSDQGCTGQFNPPHGSHFSGVWERQIVAIRRILDAMLLETKGQKLTHELLVTLISEVSAIVNAHPVTTTPSDSDKPLDTFHKNRVPIHWALSQFVSQDLYARRRWRKVQHRVDQFWSRWRREYLQNIQVRTKCNRVRCNLLAGDIGMLTDKQTKRNNRPLGRVFDGNEDGRFRKATVLTCRMVKGGPTNGQSAHSRLRFPLTASLMTLSLRDTLLLSFRSNDP